jgi:hypothetical protein
VFNHGEKNLLSSKDRLASRNMTIWWMFLKIASNMLSTSSFVIGEVEHLLVGLKRHEIKGCHLIEEPSGGSKPPLCVRKICLVVLAIVFLASLQSALQHIPKG